MKQRLGGEDCVLSTHVLGASGLSLLPSRWALDLKMLALFILGRRISGHHDDKF